MKEQKLSEPKPQQGAFGFRINPPIFWISFLAIVFFVVASLLYLDTVNQFFRDVRAFIAGSFGWYYILIVNILCLICLYLAFGKYKHIKIGGVSAKPEFTYWQWFAMLFNAGIGLVIMFYSLTEPLYHYSNPPQIEGYTGSPVQLAFGLTFLHWGIHGWAIYGLLGLAVAFFAYNRGLPLSLSSVLHPILGNRIYAWPGLAVDILSTIATLFGLATTLGIGIQYINSGLFHLFGLKESTFIQILLVSALSIAATISLILGLKKGIKNLSLISAWMAVTILMYIFLVGPTTFILNALVENTGFYLQNIIALGSWSETFTDSHWQDQWTVFYWGWWFAWAPFVGIFVARISKGRTIQEFIAVVILIPTLAIIIWVTILGGAGIYEELFGSGNMVAAINDNMSTALYVLLEQYPFAKLIAAFIVLTGCIFFVTSSDSGSFVIDCITSATDGGKTPKIQRSFWCILEGIVACILLLSGGLVALQTASLVAGLPIALLMVPIIYALFKELKLELKHLKTNELSSGRK